MNSESGFVCMIVVILLLVGVAFVESNCFNDTASTERFEVLEFNMNDGVVVYKDGYNVERMSFSSFGFKFRDIIVSNETYLLKSDFKVCGDRYDLYVNLSDVQETE